MDSICGEKTKLVYLDHGGGRLLLASAHLESVVLVLALRAVVPPSLATFLAVSLAESLVLLLGPFAGWGLGGSRAGNAACSADYGSGSPRSTQQPQEQQQQREAETRAILDRVFEGVLCRTCSPGWSARMAPWGSFEPSCLHLALPSPLHQQLTALVVDHAAQRHRAPFSFFRKHSCLMFRGLLLASDLHPLHARQLWQLLWALGVMQHSAGLPCQVLTRIIHLPQPSPAAAAAGGRPTGPGAAGGGGGGGPTSSASGSAAATAAAAAAAVALQAEAGVTVSEQPMGRSLLVVISALNFVLAVVLTAYDEVIDEEETGRLEGEWAAALLQRIHATLGDDLERLVAASAVYSSASHALESHPPPAGPPDLTASARTPVPAPAKGAPGAGGAGGPTGSGGSLLFRALTRNKSTPKRGSKPPVELPVVSRSTPASPSGKSLLGRSAASAGVPPAAAGGSHTPTQPQHQHLHPPHRSPPASQPHDRSQAGGPPLLLPPIPALPPPPPAFPPVPAPEGVMLLIVHDAPQGCVRFMGDLTCGPPGGAGAGGGGAAAALAAVWRAVAACRARFGLHNVAVAAPPKHARLAMTLDQIQQLSAARSQKSGGQRLGTADSSPWQYHPELASLAAVNTVTLRLPGLRLWPDGTVWAEEAEAAGPRQPVQQPSSNPQATPTVKSWLARMSGSRHGSRPGASEAPTAGLGSGLEASGDAAATPRNGATSGSSNYSPPSATTPVGASSSVAAPAGPSGAVYLTAVLFPDTREVYMCHGADLDEGRLAEAMWDGSAGAELWVRESMGVA